MHLEIVVNTSLPSEGEVYEKLTGGNVLIEGEKGIE